MFEYVFKLLILAFIVFVIQMWYDCEHGCDISDVSFQCKVLARTGVTSLAPFLAWPFLTKKQEQNTCFNKQTNNS